MIPSAAPPSLPPQKAGGLAIAAIIFASLFFLPLVPLVGGILGIVALATSPPSRPRGMAITATVLGLVFGLGNGCMAALAIPAFVKYVRRAKSAEAHANSGLIYRSAVAYYESEQLGSDGKILTHRFPAAVEWTPAGKACDLDPPRYMPDPSLWNHPTWRALHFSVDGPSYYQYRFQVLRGDGSHPGDEATVEVQGDLDCDGTYSLFERRLVVGADGMIAHSLGPRIERESE